MEGEVERAGGADRHFYGSVVVTSAASHTNTTYPRCLLVGSLRQLIDGDATSAGSVRKIPQDLLEVGATGVSGGNNAAAPG